MSGTWTVPVVEGTGEVVSPDHPLDIEGIRSLAEVETEVQALTARLDEMVAEIIAEFPEVAALKAKADAAGARARAIRAELADAFSDEKRLSVAQGITLDMGAVRVSWPKPSVRWAQRVTAAMIAAQDPELAKTLGIRQVTSNPPAPRVTIRGPQ